MAEPDVDDEREQAVSVAKQVAAGTDGIAVPSDLVDDAPHQERAAEKALWVRIRAMSVAEKVKLALRGNKDARTILMRDTNRMIPRFVLQNPRISENEILMIATDRNSNEEILRTIADSREWTNVYAIRAALVENPRTPAAKALGLVATLGEQAISRLAKSKSVPSVIATHARRLMSRRSDPNR